MCSLVIGGTLIGDRNTDLDRLGVGHWDAVVYGLGGERSEAGLNGVLGVGSRWTQWSFLC